MSERFRGLRAVVVAGAVLVGLVLAPGCGRPVSAHDAADLAFVTRMIPHHALAVEMNQWALVNTEDVRVRKLAFEMSYRQQSPEIVAMEGWRATWQVDDAGGSRNGHAHQRMDDEPMGMLSDAERAALAEARGPDFDRLYLPLMIRHHEGAVAMAHEELVGGANREARALAATIVKVQEAQITLMKNLLGALG